MKQLLTVAQVAEVLQVHQKSVYRFIAEGRLKTIRLGGNRIRFSEKEVREFLTQKDGTA